MTRQISKDISQPTPGQRGMILIIVLWTIAALTAIVVSLSSYAQKNLSLAAVETIRLRSDMLLLSGLEAGKAMIFASRPEERFFLSQTTRRISLGQGDVVDIEIADAGGRIDLNRTPIAMVAMLADQFKPDRYGAGDVLASVVQLREKRRKTEPAEQDKGTRDRASSDSISANKQPPMALFVAEAQIRALASQNSTALQELIPLVTLYSIDGKVNPMAAADQVLRSVPEIKPEHLGLLIAARDSKRWKEPDVQKVLALYPDFLTIRDNKVFVITVTTQVGPNVTAASTLRATVILDEQAEVPFQTLSLSW
jgi:type II secretory pathway component PulK